MPFVLFHKIQFIMFFFLIIVCRQEGFDPVDLLLDIEEYTQHQK
jgi:hypothetical protein